MLPQFTVHRLDSELSVCVGTFDAIRSPDATGYLWIEEWALLEGQFVDFSPELKSAAFVPRASDGLKSLYPQQSYPYLFSWWGFRVELTLDHSRQWQKVSFSPQDAILFRRPSGNVMRKANSSGRCRIFPEEPEEERSTGGELVPEGWDHEHCEFFMETIGSGGESEGYRNQYDEWICTHCYEAYVATRTPSFLVPQILHQISGLGPVP